MNRLTILAGTAVLLGGTVARADTEETPLDPLDPVRIVSPLTLVQGDGIKIGEGTAFYPQVGLETGFESNTFYQPDNPVGAGILRLLIEAGLGSLSKSRLVTQGEDIETVTLPDFVYDASAYANYDQYLSSNGDVTNQGGLGLGFHGKFAVHPQQPVAFLATERFDRILRSENFETRGNINRDINALALRLEIHPAGRSLGGSITYNNTIDVFENNPNYADRLQNTLTAKLGYTFLPLSTLFVQAAGSYFTGIGTATTPKITSFPMVFTAGISTALTVETSLAAQAGYAQGNYASGPDYQSFTGGLYFEYRYSPLSAFRARYSYEHQDSINANFYRDHVFQAWLEQKLIPFAVYISPELRLREYQGIIGAGAMQSTRDDIIFAVALGARYQFRNWIAASAEYRFVDDSSSYRYDIGTAMIDPSYMRHELFAGIRAAY